MKPQGHTNTYALSRDYMPQAYGSDPQGEDGGAFIEFRDAPTGNDTNGVPKYGVMIEPTSPDDPYILYINEWFDNRASSWDYYGNVVYLQSGDMGGDDSGWADEGWYAPSEGTCIVFTRDGTKDPTFRDKTVVHEIGHRFGLRTAAGGAYSYIDYPYGTDKRGHSNNAYCIMNYRSLAPSNSSDRAEFSIECLINGSSSSSDDSLRSAFDR